MIDKKWSRINVIGTSGSGKSTFAKQLSEQLGFPYVEIDLVFWEPNWKQPQDDVFLPKLATALDQPNWVLDGNYARTVPVKWKNVTSVIWLDYSFPRVMYQIVKRTILRALHGKELWPGTGNTESLRKSFLSKDSIIKWAFDTYGTNKKRYEANLVDPKFSHIHFVRLITPTEAKTFLLNLATSASKRSTEVEPS